MVGENCRTMGKKEPSAGSGNSAVYLSLKDIVQLVGRRTKKLLCVRVLWVTALSCVILGGGIIVFFVSVCPRPNHTP